MTCQPLTDCLLPAASMHHPPQMHVTYSKHRNLVIRPGERSRDYTVTAPGAAAPAPVGGPGHPPAAGGAPPAAQPQAAAPYGAHPGAHPAGPPAGAPPGAYPPPGHAAPQAPAMGGPPAGMHPAAGGPPPARPYGAPPAAAAPQHPYATAGPPPTKQHYDPNVVVTGALLCGIVWGSEQFEWVLGSGSLPGQPHLQVLWPVLLLCSPRAVAGLLPLLLVGHFAHLCRPCPQARTLCGSMSACCSRRAAALPGRPPPPTPPRR